MLSTIGGILVTLFSFCVTAVVVVVGYVVALIPQVWNLAVQSFHLVQNLFA
jgi:lipid-A-disaccharide synthase-like uncharacterized protein